MEKTKKTNANEIPDTDDENLRYQFYALDKALEKVKDPELVKDIRHTAYGILGSCEAFYLSLGAYIGQRYQILDPTAQKEIEDIGKLMAEEKVFPLIPKQVTAARQSEGAPAGVIPARILNSGNGGEKRRSTSEKSEYMTAVQVAEKFRVSRSWVLRKAQAGIMPNIKVGGVIRFSEKAVSAWMESHGTKGCQKI